MITKYLRYKVGNELVRLPLLSVRLGCNGKHTIVWALIDSGAELCVFNSQIAELLNVDVRSGTLLSLGGLVDGSELPSWLHQINLTVKELGSIDLRVAFTDLTVPGMCILGQKGFFDNFQVRFSRYRDEIEIWPKGTTP